MKDPRDSLFRKEVTEARKRRLQGEVILKQSTSARWIVVCLTLVSLAAGLWITTGEYSRTEQALGILETTKPSAKVIATRPGIVAELDVAEGDLVLKGDRLALIDVDRKNEFGLASAAVSLSNIEDRARNWQTGQSTGFTDQ